MPAKSKSQQRFFGMVRAAQKGDMKNPSKEVSDVAGDISMKDAKKFAKTKHKGLPEIKEGKKKGLWDNIHAKRKRGERPARKGEKDYPKTLNVEHNDGSSKNCKKGEYFCKDDHKCKPIPEGHHVMPNGKLMKGEKHSVKEEKRNCGCGKDPCITYGKKKKIEENSATFQIDKSAHKAAQKKTKMRNLAIGNANPNEKAAAEKKAGGPKLVGEGAAWTKKSGKNKEGGLNEKGRKSYERENPGSDLKAPQPEGGSRKKSFCARMGGMKKKLTSAKTANDPDSRINKSLRKWKCNEEELKEVASYKDFTKKAQDASERVKKAKQTQKDANAKSAYKDRVTKGVQFYDKKGKGHIRDGKKVYS